jgi:hypothetical protein
MADYSNNKYNLIFENLENRSVQEAPLKLIRAHNDFAVFDKGTTDSYGSEDEFIGDQPLSGVE